MKAKRGDILDRNGVLLAGSAGSFGIYVRTRCVTDPQAVARVLSELLTLDYQSLYNKINNKGVSEITVATRVDKDVVNKLTEYSLSGVYFAPDNTRVYPFGSALCQTLGYLSSDGIGQSGLEKYYDSYLRGDDGEIMYESDLIGNDAEGKLPEYVAATPGLSLKLTVDHQIQLICENEISKAVEKYSPKSAKVIVLDPSNGQILAICQQPSFDLNFVPRDNMQELMVLSRNGLIADSYEPGSTFKVITVSANVEEYLKGNRDAFSENYVFPSSRYRIVGGRKIKCWTTHDNGKHANENLALALNNSCNPIFVDIALALGKDVMYQYIDCYNFGKSTGVDFQGEALGMLVPKTAVTDGDLARIGFGQTIAVTPIQLAAAVSAAINGGVYYRPYFLQEILNSDKTVSRSYPVEEGRVISQEASSIIAGYLENVVSQGSGKQAYIEGYRVGGKTGTAQKYENGVISAGKYVMSFVGFFPANSPKYLALVTVDEPIGGTYGSTVAAPICKSIFEGIIKVKNLKMVSDEN